MHEQMNIVVLFLHFSLVRNNVMESQTAQNMTVYEKHYSRESLSIGFIF